MELTWINHAGFIVRSAAGTALAVDPWLSGSAFDDGWDLLSPTALEPAELAACDHIWISHEHPDHFSPAALKSIPEERRGDITVWFRATRDRRVALFCEGLGFTVREMVAHEPCAAGDLVLRCGPVEDDSWLRVDADGRVLVDMNDCEFRHRSALDDLGGEIGPIDVLVTQFSYANGVSGPDDAALRRQRAEQKLQQVAHQVAAFRPDVVVPGASFVWFSHVENRHANDEMVTVDRAAAHITSLGPRVVVLYPGDRWEVGTDHDPDPAVARYLADHAGLDHRPRHRSDPVPDADLVAQGASAVARMRSANQLWTLRPLLHTRYLRPARLRVTDGDAGVYRFDMFRGLVRLPPDAAEVDIAISSSALSFCLRTPFGLNTLLVNGRFVEETPGGLFHLRAQLAPAVHNSHGRSFPRLLVSREFWRDQVRPLVTRRRRPFARRRQPAHPSLAP